MFHMEQKVGEMHMERETDKEGGRDGWRDIFTAGTCFVSVFMCVCVFYFHVCYILSTLRP